jgi:hypothetical protein
MDQQTERGVKGSGGGASTGGGGGSTAGTGGGRGRAAAGLVAGTEAGAESAVGVVAAASARSSGLTRRRPTFKKVSGEVAEDIYDELKDYLRFVKSIEGEEPDMGTVLENALDGLFKRAKGFKAWRKEEGADEEVEEVLAGLGGAVPQGAAAGGGAQAGAAR